MIADRTIAGMTRLSVPFNYSKVTIKRMCGLISFSQLKSNRFVERFISDLGYKPLAGIAEMSRRRDDLLIFSIRRRDYARTSFLEKLT